MRRDTSAITEALWPYGDLMPATLTLTRYADVVAVLGDERFQVPPVPPAGPGVDLAWLRATVSRFASGEEHAHRRRLGLAELGRLAPDDLRRSAANLAKVMHAEAVPVEVLASALGCKAPVYDLVAKIASGYQPGTDAGAAGDVAVRHLVDLFGGIADEITAARIAVLVQACSATATLVSNALRGWRQWRPQASAAAIVAETLRHDPPAPSMRRVCVESTWVGENRIELGDLVTLDLRAANRDPDIFPNPDQFDPTRSQIHLSFGAGLRPCPGRDHAFAIAVGVVETLISEEVHL